MAVKDHGSPISEWVHDIVSICEIDSGFDDEEIIECVAHYMKWYCYVQEHMDDFVTKIKVYVAEQSEKVA